MEGKGRYESTKSKTVAGSSLAALPALFKKEIMR